MPIRYDIEPGGEYLLPFAKKKLAELRAEAKNRNLRSLQKRIMVDSGSSISLSTQASFGETTQDSIRVTGGVQYMFATIFSAISATRVYSNFSFSGGSFSKFTATTSKTQRALMSSVSVALGRKQMTLVAGLLAAFASNFVAMVDYQGTLFVNLPILLAALTDSIAKNLATALLTNYNYAFSTTALVAPSDPTQLTGKARSVFFGNTKAVYYVAGYSSTFSTSVSDNIIPVTYISSANTTCTVTRQEYVRTKDGWVLNSTSIIGTIPFMAGVQDDGILNGVSVQSSADSGSTTLYAQSYSNNVAYGTFRAAVSISSNLLSVIAPISGTAITVDTSSTGDFATSKLITTSGVIVSRMMSGDISISVSGSDTSSLVVMSETQQVLAPVYALNYAVPTPNDSGLLAINSYASSTTPMAVLAGSSSAFQGLAGNLITLGYTLGIVDAPVVIYDDFALGAPLGNTSKLASIYNIRTGGFMYVDVSNANFNTLQTAFLADPTGTTVDSSGNTITKLQAVLNVAKIVYSSGIPTRLAAFAILQNALILV